MRRVLAPILCLAVAVALAGCGGGGGGEGSAVGLIPFISERDGGKPQLFIMDWDGTNIRQLTHWSDAVDTPKLSPDGSKVVFVGYDIGNSDIYVINSDGTGLQQLTTDPHSNLGPAFSGDGSKIVFQSYRDGNSEIYVMDADGGNQTRLTENTDYDGWPAFSPDSSKIAFCSSRDGYYETHIYVMNSDGSEPTRLTTQISQLNASPNFSPDGSKIIFISYYGPEYGDPVGSDVSIMDSNGSSPTRLTYTGVADGCPVFSHDGLRIAFGCRVIGNGDIFIVHVDGSNLTDITSNPAWDGFFWQDIPYRRIAS